MAPLLPTRPNTNWQQGIGSGASGISMSGRRARRVQRTLGRGRGQNNDDDDDATGKRG